ncbi:MAG: peptide chain release factor N(5)-glutamine methyltransferase [Bacteroidota bacterium]
MFLAKQIWEETITKLHKIYVYDEAKSIAFVLFEDLLGVSRSDILAEKLVEIDKEKLDYAVMKVLKHEPVQYVTGRVEFLGRNFKVSSEVLIPRPETEELAHLIIQENQLPKPKILDVGTGSGCLAISLQLAFKGEAFAVDISKEALELARHNASSLQSNVSFLEVDVLNDDLQETSFDLLVSNPPYIPDSDRAFMDANVLNHEPGLALFVADENPFIFYDRIAALGRKILSTGALLYFEIHERFGAHVQQILVQSAYSNVQVMKDMQGKDRFVKAVKD